jgi:hypothetical protein
MCHYKHGVDLFLEDADSDIGNTSVNHHDYSSRPEILEKLMKTYPRVFTEFSAVVVDGSNGLGCGHIKLILCCQCGAQSHPQYYHNYLWAGGINGESLHALENLLRDAVEKSMEIGSRSGAVYCFL